MITAFVVCYVDPYLLILNYELDRHDTNHKDLPGQTPVFARHALLQIEILRFHREEGDEYIEFV